MNMTLQPLTNVDGCAILESQTNVDGLRGIFIFRTDQADADGSA